MSIFFERTSNFSQSSNARFSVRKFFGTNEASIPASSFRAVAVPGPMQANFTFANLLFSFLATKETEPPDFSLSRLKKVRTPLALVKVSSQIQIHSLSLCQVAQGSKEDEFQWKGNQQRSLRVAQASFSAQCSLP